MHLFDRIFVIGTADLDMYRALYYHRVYTSPRQAPGPDYCLLHIRSV